MDLTAAAPPGCLVVLIARSAAAADDARRLADELINRLIGLVAPVDVAVIGYSADADGALELASLLSDGRPRVQLLPLGEVATLPRGGERPWMASPGGAAPAAAALAEVYRLIAIWLTGRYQARPPLVIHCHDGGGIDEEYARVARSLELLATAHGPVRLRHFDSAADWETFWSVLIEVAPVAQGAWEAEGSARFTPSVRELWVQKLGNAPEEWEDAFATDRTRGIAVVADGASTGIYCRLWAEQLTRAFVAAPPDARDPVDLANWVHELRCDWRAAIGYRSLSGTMQRKVDEAGAAATLLGLEVGPLDAAGNRPWRATAIGDSSLFWLRDGRVLATFPVVAAEQFGATPLLVRSNPGFRTLALSAAGACRAGDRFLLATDAVAQRLFRTLASTNWGALDTVELDSWRAELDGFRRANEIVNDDCTLLVVTVAGE